MSELAFYSEHSVFTDPGSFAPLWDQVEPTIPAMTAAIQPLLFHYRAHGDWAENGIAADRVAEINLRYADAMLARIEELEPIEPGQYRDPANRMVGCCRDWALLFVSLARHHGFAARSRVGFASYFDDGWWIDHTIAEVWDETEQRWRLVDAELPDEFVPVSGEPFDPIAVSRDRFLPGLDAWRRVRSGELDAGLFVVAPETDVPQLRGIPYLWHNVVQDLASLNRHEMVLWDVWGVDLDPVNDVGANLLDDAAATSGLAERQELFARDEFRVPGEVQSFLPYRPLPPEMVKLRGGRARL